MAPWALLHVRRVHFRRVQTTWHVVHGRKSTLAGNGDERQSRATGAAAHPFVRAALVPTVAFARRRRPGHDGIPHGTRGRACR